MATATPGARPTATAQPATATVTPTPAVEILELPFPGVALNDQPGPVRLVLEAVLAVPTTPKNLAKIASVTFVVKDARGREVHRRTERTERYCGFGGGDNGGECTVHDFAKNGNKWPGGAARVAGEHSLEVSVMSETKGGTPWRASVNQKFKI